MEYFTKWVEVESLVYTTGMKITNFVQNRIIYQFGISHKILLDNGMYFKNQHVRALCNGYNIQHSFSTSYYPQGNG